MKNLAIVIPVLVLCSFCISAKAKAWPDSTSISSSDLDNCIDSLPAAAKSDPVTTLHERLIELNKRNEQTDESQGLHEALGLIGLARTIRITAQNPEDSHSILAGL